MGEGNNNHQKKKKKKKTTKKKKKKKKTKKWFLQNFAKFCAKNLNLHANGKIFCKILQDFARFCEILHGFFSRALIEPDFAAKL